MALNGLAIPAVIAAGAAAAIVAVSYLVEAARSAPTAPGRLSWAPDLPVRYVGVEGVRLRYITTGGGRPLVLLHTLRSQLDLFQKVIPDLASRFQVYALDYPGHGYSDIPNTDYTPEFFVTSVTRFLEQLSIADAVIVGESIGGNIALVLAARRNPRVRQAVAINPADYGASRALRRSSTLANLLFGLNDIPVLGPTVMRLRTYEVTKKIFEGGVYRRDALPPGLAHEMYEVGNRRGHYRAFMSLVRHGPEWERARREYGNIVVPTLLLYGDRDWSRPQEREYTARAIPGARMEVLKDVGHFASLDAPQQVVRAILDFLGEAV